MTSESESSTGWEEPAAEGQLPPAPQERSFFTFWKCCGCLVLLGVMVTVAGVIAFNLALNSLLPRTPIEIPPVEYVQSQVEEIQARFDAALPVGETVTVTPEELTIVVTDWIRTGSPLGERSGFYCTTTADGLLDARLCLEIPETEETPFWLRGRFVTVSLVGNMTIEAGEVTSAKFSSFQFGDWIDEQSVPEEESRRFVDQMREQSKVNPDLRAKISRVKLFRFDGKNIELAIEPE